MNITTGAVVAGSDFFDREGLIGDLWEALRTESVLLAAPRRVGKTSIMRRLLDDPAGGFRPLFLDCQAFGGPEELTAELVLAIDRAFGKRRRLLSKILDRIDDVEVWELRVKLRKMASGKWREQAESAIRYAISALSEETDGPVRLLLILDELPILLHKLINREGKTGIHAAQDLLDWLRHLRMDPEFGPHLRVLAGGSIGLPRIASSIGSSSKINDLRQVTVQPFDRTTARDLTTGLLKSRNVEISNEAMETLLDQVEPFIPIFIQIMAGCVASEVRQKGTEATPAMIRECYEDRALGPDYRIVFEDYYERLDRYYSPSEARVAKRLLRELAVAEAPMKRASLLAAYMDEIGADAREEDFHLLLQWLRDDFYLEDVDGSTIMFRVTWLRDWWRRYHVS